MLKIILVRPGATDFDDQGRIKGSLDMPLSECGQRQVDQLAGELSSTKLMAVLSGPGESARATAGKIAQGRGLKVKVVDEFRNLDHGLWHGKLVEEVRRQQPRVYRQGEEDPASVCPPGGETLEDARERVVKSLKKLVKKNRNGSLALVIPDPMASVVHCLLCHDDPKSLWSSEVDAGKWEVIELGAKGQTPVVVG